MLVLKPFRDSLTYSLISAVPLHTEYRRSIIMRITINQHRERIGNYHHDKMAKHAILSNKKVSGKVHNTDKEKSFTLNIQNVVPSHQVYRHIDSRFRLKQIICFILLLNHVRGHTRLSQENSETSPLSLGLKEHSQTLPFLNEHLRFKEKNKPNHHTHEIEKQPRRKIRDISFSIADGITNSTIESPEKVYIFSKTGIITNDEKLTIRWIKEEEMILLKMQGNH